MEEEIKNRRKNNRKINFKDNRGRKIVYVSCCLLNQNARTPGVAIRKGALTELIQMFLNNDIGIEQLPCMECRLWGGVSRKTIHTLQPLVLNSVGRSWFPFIEFVSNIMFRKTKYACRKEAKKIVKRIQDYIMERYTIIGILGVNCSPTCGVTKTMDHMDIAKNKDKFGITLQDLMNPQLEKMIEIAQKTSINGSGFFFSCIMKELNRRKMDIRVIGVDIDSTDSWSKPQKEVGRIAGLLNLKI
jgi:predicted secreted protein